MYELIKQVITNRTYNDSNALIAKIRRLYIEGTLTEEQYTELRTLMAEVEPVKQYNAVDEIDRIWSKLHEIESRLDNIGTQTEEEQPSEEVIDDFKLPKGAHDAYRKGAKVRYNGVIYESLIDGNNWAPDVYPQGWRVVEEGEVE